MASKPDRSSDTPTGSRIGTNNDRADAQEGTSNIPSYSTTRSPADLARIRAFTDVIRDAIGEYGSITELSPTEAARRGCLGTLKSLHRRGRMMFDKELCKAAARGGQLEVLQWLRENDCPWNADTYVGAAHGGKLKVLQWARKKGCPWDVMTCAAATECGNLEVLKWLRQNSCPWNLQNCASIAADIGHKKLSAWIVNGTPDSGNKADKAEHIRETPLYIAVRDGRKAAVRALF